MNRAPARRSEAFDRLLRVLVFVLLVAGAAAFAAPFYVSVAMALKTPEELARTPAWSWPQRPTLDNFRTVLSNPGVPFGLLLRNTTFVTLVGTAGEVLSCAMAAYAFARLRFPGRDRLFLILLSTMMLPGIVTMIPTYVMYSKLGWVNTYYPLTLPAYFAIAAFSVFLLRQFFMGIPRELDEAAQLDGAGYLTVFARIVLPLARPALATVALFSVMNGWRDFMGPLLYLNDPRLQTLEVGLNSYNSLHGNEWHLVLAGSVLVALPLIVIFFLGQRFFIKGVVMSGLK